MRTANGMAGGLGARRPRGLRGAGLALIAMICMAAVPPAWGTSTYTLEDQNSTVNVAVDGLGSGMTNWIVNGADHMAQQWFWYRIGSGSARPIDSLNLVGAQAIDTNWDGANDLLRLRFGDGTMQNSTFFIDVGYTLTGGQPGQAAVSDIQETVTIQNRTAGTQVFHFFQYTDFDLGGTPYDDWVSIGGQNHNTADQQDGGTHAATQTVITPAPGRYEAAMSGDTLAALLGVTAYDLSNAAFAGPGNVAWAYQWDFTLGSGQSFIISEDNNMTHLPEPVTMAGLLLGVGCLARYVRRRKP